MNSRIIIYTVSIIGVLALVYILEFNQVSAARMRLLDIHKQQQELNLVYQEYAIIFSPLESKEKIKETEEKLKLERIKEFALMEAGEAQLSLRVKKYE